MGAAVPPNPCAGTVGQGTVDELMVRRAVAYLPTKMPAPLSQDPGCHTSGARFVGAFCLTHGGPLGT